jgi:hypothetical protein
MVEGLAMGLARLRFEAAALFAGILAAQGAPDCARSVLAFALAQPDLHAQGRDDLDRQLALLGGPTVPASAPWRGPDLEGLLRQVIAEGPSGYAALIAALRG